MEIIKCERQKKKILKSEQNLRDLWAPANAPTYMFWESQKEKREIKEQKESLKK